MKPHGLDGGGDAFDEGADWPGTGRDEAEDAGLGCAGGAFAGAVDHQPRQLDHQVRFGAGGLEEGFARQGQDLAVPQGDDGGGVRRAGQHGHLAHRLARLDHAQHVRRLIRLHPKHAQSAGADQIQGVGRIAFGEQRLAAGQRKPAGPVDHATFEDSRERGRQRVGAKRGHDPFVGAILKRVNWDVWACDGALARSQRSLEGWAERRAFARSVSL